MTTNDILSKDILSAEGIKTYLDITYSQLQPEVRSIVTSTNTLAKEQAKAGIAEGYVLLADAQTGGRGRLGRSFFSPSQTGLYMSIVLRPAQWTAQQTTRLTTIAAAAVSEAIETVTGQHAPIKWVNDIFVDNKKVCGILTEASFGAQDGFTEYAIVGIGVNVYTPEDGFPTELQAIAGAVWNTLQANGKNRLAAEILNRFMRYYTSLCNNDTSTDYIQAYRKRSLVLGKEIRVLHGDTSRMAVALDIDDDCHLLVEYEDGTRETLSSGEISIRLT